MSIVRLATVSWLALLFASAGPGLPPALAHESPAAKSDSPPPAGAVLIGTDLFRHNGWHSRVFFTDGGKSVVAAGEGGIHWWDLATGARVHELAQPGRYEDAAFAADANVLAVVGAHLPNGEAGNFEPAVWLIDASARKLLRTVTLPAATGGNRHKVQISADGKRVFVEQEGDVQILDGKTGDELLRHKARINAGALAASRDGRLVAFGRYDVFLWRWEAGEEPKKFAAIGNFGVERMQFSPDGKALYVDPHGEVITVWDVATGRQTASRPLRSMVGSLAFSPDGQMLAVATHAGISKAPEGGHAIDLLDAATWKEVGRVPLGRKGVGQVTWSPDGTRLAAVTDHRVWAWNAKTGKVLGPDRPGHDSTISAMAFGPDGTLFTASDDCAIRSWDPATGAPQLQLVHDAWVRDLAVSPDGTLVAGSALSNDLRVWDAKTGKLRFKLLGNGTMGGKRLVRFTADGTRLVAWGDDEFVRVWDVRNGKLLSEHSTDPSAAEGDPDDPFGKQMQFLKRTSAGVDLSADGAALALTAGKAVRLLDPMTGKDRQIMPVGDNLPQAFAFSPDAKRILVAYRGKSVQTKLPDGRTRHSVEPQYPLTLWELASGKPVWTAAAEGSWPRLAYSPDGTRAAVLSSVPKGPSRVWVWDVRTGQEAGRMELPRPGHQLAFDRTGRKLAVSFEDTTALIYDLREALKAAK